LAREFLAAIRPAVVAALPGSPAKGDTVVLDGNGHLYTYDGAAWVDNGAAGGGGSIAQSTLAVATIQLGAADIVVAVPGVTGTSKILAQLVPNAEWDADDLAEISVVPTPGTDQITFTILRNGPIVGDFAVNYQVS